MPIVTFQLDAGGISVPMEPCTWLSNFQRQPEKARRCGSYTYTFRNGASGDGEDFLR